MILEIDNIELNYGNKRILYAIYLKGESGKVTGILGRNGCGKTSLLRILFGNLSPKYQTIRIDGNHQKKKLFKSGQIAYLPQHRLLPGNIKLSTAFSFYNLHWNEFIDLFESFAIYKNTRVDKLSSGEVRIVETYLILNSGKSIILLDEPFSFIAPIYVEKFKVMIQKKKRNGILIITDHFYNDLVDVSDTLYVLKNGYSKLIHSTEELANEGYISFNPLRK